MPAGQPSISTPIAFPWLSPNVPTRNIVPNMFPDGYVNAYESDNFPLYMEISDKAELARKKLEKLLLGEKYANPEDLKHLSDMMSKVIDMFSLSENHTTDKKPVLKL